MKGPRMQSLQIESRRQHLFFCLIWERINSEAGLLKPPLQPYWLISTSQRNVSLYFKKQTTTWLSWWKCQSLLMCFPRHPRGHCGDDPRFLRWMSCPGKQNRNRKLGSPGDKETRQPAWEWWMRELVTLVTVVPLCAWAGSEQRWMTRAWPSRACTEGVPCTGWVTKVC